MILLICWQPGTAEAVWVNVINHDVWGILNADERSQCTQQEKVVLYGSVYIRSPGSRPGSYFCVTTQLKWYAESELDWSR